MFWVDYIIVPVIILLGMVIDKSLETIRVFMITKVYKKLAPIIGFFQVLIWNIT